MSKIQEKKMGKINVAIIGAGNCASSLVQGLYKYSEVDETSEKFQD